MESEQSKIFNERLSQWVASQGFWFQLRHSMTGSGAGGNVMFHLLRLSFRLLILLLILGACGAIYLLQVPNSPKFSSKLGLKLKEGLRASSATLKGVAGQRGNLVINQLDAEGGNQTFFKFIMAEKIACKMGLLSSISSRWDTGSVTIEKLEMELQAGADDAESAGKFAEALFALPTSVTVNNLEIADTSLNWGYTERTRGRIEHSVLRVNREEGRWRLTFTGGTFSQNWLQQLEIVELVVVCDREGMTFETANFQSDKGTMSCAGFKVKGGERPLLEGKVVMQNLPVQNLIPEAATSVIEGSISGQFQVSGSTNSKEGIGFEGQIVLSERSGLTLSDRVYLLKALSAVDYKHSYRKMKFDEGNLRLKTTGGGIVLSDINIKAADLLTIKGNMLARMPTAEETEESGDKPEDAWSGGGASGLAPQGPVGETDNEPFGNSVAAVDKVSNRISARVESRKMEARASDYFARTLRYEGQLNVSIAADAFNADSKLSQRYPVSSSSKRIEIPVELEGTLEEITLKQGEEIYKLRESDNR